MIIIGPVAVAANNVIGGDNDLPWYLPEDLKHFKKITLGKTVLMGRKTYDSIIKRLGKPLPGRKSVVITRNPAAVYTPPHEEGQGEVIVYDNIEQAFDDLKNEDIYIIGGAQIFALAFPKAEHMHMTHVKKEYPGDVYFPEVNWSEWEKINEEPHEEYTFVEYKKKQNKN